MKEQLEKIREEALRQIESSEALEKLNDIRVSYLGKKGGLTNLLKSMKDVVPEDRPEMGQMVNDVRGLIEGRLKGARAAPARKVREEQLKGEIIDVILSVRKNNVGHSHPNTIALEKVERIFVGMGYEVVERPEVEYDRHDFERLNISKSHPARDEQDALYINENILLRSQTSPIQVCTMGQGKLPIHTIAPGCMLRSDKVDATHSPPLHQIEGLATDKNVTSVDLKGALTEFARGLSGPETKVKFCPHHPPFTKPSAEVDVTCFRYGDSGYRFYRGPDWIGILGRGIVHPYVLEMCGIDPDACSGFAFGVGLERIALLRYEIDDMRLLYENDIRFLKQF